MKTMIYLVIDRSSSMAKKESDVIEGINKFIEEQKKLPDPACIAFVRFNENVERFRPMTPLSDTQPLTLEDYKPFGWTALYDAMGMTITAAEQDWRQEKPDRAIMVTITDGKENSSKEFTSKSQIRALIEPREASGLWSFVFLGADFGAFAEAEAMGINLKNTASYSATNEGVRAAYGAVGQSVSMMRATGSTVAQNLGGHIPDSPKPTPQEILNTVIAKQAVWQPPQGIVQPTPKWTPPV